jgi:MauM/NapG family ferredoxin protein
LCSARCPTGTIDPQAGYRSDPSECIVCTDCLRNCNQGKVTFRWQLNPWRTAARQPYDPSRRDALAAMATAVGAVALAGIEPITHRSPARLIRPPGALLTNFESLCIRCGECVRVCPTQGLQPVLLEAGWQNLMTPHLVSRLGYCVFNCSACIQSCPSGAIPKMTIEEKHAAPMGLASINRDRCLPWAYNTPCVVCEEMCPVPDKAIILITENNPNENLDLLKPRMVWEKCIGCGVCEFHCPVGGEAAIQVYSIPDNKPPLSGI